jgi:hypothetical protein
MALERHYGTLADHPFDTNDLVKSDFGIDRKAEADRIWKQIWLLGGAAVMLLASIVILCFQRGVLCRGVGALQGTD